MRLFRKGSPGESGVHPPVMADFVNNLLRDKVLIEVKPVQDLIGELQTLKDEPLSDEEVDERGEYWEGYNDALDSVINMLTELTYA